MNGLARFSGCKLKNIEKNVVLTARVMIFAAFEYIVFARGLRALPLCQCDFFRNFFHAH